jgi:hypothetical protein
MNLKKWIPRFFFRRGDGGSDSGVTGYFLIEWKALFSIGVLHFREGSREAYHNHAFNALTWWLSGGVTEDELSGERTQWRPSIKPKITKRDKFHKITAQRETWALTLRGRWVDYWKEFKGGKIINLTHGRKILENI